MRRMGKLAALCVALAACVAPGERGAPRVAVGGDSPIVPAIERVSKATGVPAELLATIAHAETRFRIADDSEGHGRRASGIFGLDPAALAHGAELAGVSPVDAATQIEAGLHAGAALLREAAPQAVTLDDYVAVLEPRLRSAVERSLSRGVDARDAAGRTIVIAARPVDDDGYGTIAQAVTGYPDATWFPASTSNFDEANRGVGDITNVVIHTTQGSFDGTISWFQNPTARVSAHYVVRSEDGFVAQMVSEKNIAWHDKCFNTHTVGIEHEGFIADPDVWYTEPMYVESAKLTAYLCDKYGIEKAFGPIVGHDTAPDCSDHVDPGKGWNWDHYIDLVRTGGAPTFDATEVTIDAPESLVSGQHATVVVHIVNRGNTVWEPDLTRLGTALPQDRESDLFVDGDWISSNRATSIDARVEPGEVGTFTFEIVAPQVSEPMVIDEGFQLVEEGTSWFGPDIHLMLGVRPDGSGGCETGGGMGGGAMLALVGLLAVRRRRS